MLMLESLNSIQKTKNVVTIEDNIIASNIKTEYQYIAIPLYSNKILFMSKSPY